MEFKIWSDSSFILLQKNSNKNPFELSNHKRILRKRIMVSVKLSSTTIFNINNTKKCFVILMLL